MPLILAALLHALLWWGAPCMADDKGGCEVSVAVLDLPSGCDGLLHWSDGDGATTPMQLSKRYFSETVKVKGGVIRFYREPLPAKEPTATRPNPLLAMNLPADTKLAYLVLSSAPDAEGRDQWRGNVLRGEDWKEGSLRLFNAAGETVGIIAGTKRIPLEKGRSVDFHDRDWGKPFPVKIYRAQPETKLVFSSIWRVTPGRRELCFLSNANGTIHLRSLLANPPQPQKTAR